MPGVLVAVYVDPSAIERHISSALMQHAVKIARSEHAGPVRLEATLNAVGFYEHFGFRPLERSSLQRGSITVPIILMELQ